VWTWGGNTYGQLGRGGTTTTPGRVPNLSNVVAIAAGLQFTLAATNNWQVYAWGDNSEGQVGINGIGSSTSPIPVAGISNAVWVAAHASGQHSLAVTLENGTNRFWGWGYNAAGQVGNAATTNQYAPAQLQFCTRCQRCVQLGTSGILTAQCNGTLKLYFNDASFGDNGTNFYKVTFPAFGNTNLTVLGANSDGVAAGTVTNAGIYSYSASGFCTYNGFLDKADPDGRDPSSNQVNCSFINLNITNAICPAAKCFSLVGKIQ
jgi:hypothetical protein